MYYHENLYMQAGIPTRQISAENPTGEKNGGCRAVPDPGNPDLPHCSYSANLGKGWKVRPFIKLPAGTTAELANIEGPGCINEIFLTSDAEFYSALTLRIYWDGEEIPSVECPMGAFFAMGHDYATHTVYSSMVAVAPYRGLNCYWQMPFRKRARITLSNDGSVDANVVAYRVLYKLHEMPDNAAYFHAQYRRMMTTKELPEYTILDGVKGKGLYVGTYLACNVLSSGWWGEGEVKFYLDGDEYPSIADNGLEDYFGGAWNFGGDSSLIERPNHKHEQVFSSPYLGMPLAKADNPCGPRKYGMYRWHILDSIGFSEDIKVTVQTLGWCHPHTGVYRPIPMDIASVAYWYQIEPHNSFPRYPSVEERYDL